MLRIAQELTNDPAYKGYRVFLSYGMGRRREMSKMAAQYGLKGRRFCWKADFATRRQPPWPGICLPTLLFLCGL